MSPFSRTEYPYENILAGLAQNLHRMPGMGWPNPAEPEVDRFAKRSPERCLLQNRRHLA
jgi:hypothetical protein